MNATVNDDALSRQLAEDQPSIPVAAAKPATPSAPVRQPPLDEIGPAYIEHRESLEGRAALQAQLSEGAPAAAATAPATPTVPVGDSRGYPYGFAVIPTLIGTKPIAQGLIEGPRQAFLQGPRNAFQSMLDGIHSLNQWIAEKTGTGDLVLSDKGLHWESAEELQHQPGITLHDFGKAKTVTGEVIASASQFLTSMANLARVCGPHGNGYRMNEQSRARGRELVGLEPPPPRVRHFLPPVDLRANGHAL